MKNKIIISTLFPAFFFSHFAFAQAYKCSINGGVVYQSEPCPRKIGERENTATVFDSCIFGITIDEMKRRARTEQLIIASGSTVFGSKFNKKILNSQPNQQIYTYKTKLLGKLTTVSLYFTKLTKQLYKIQATFHLMGVKPEERRYFYESLHSQLSSKYGKAKNISISAAKNSSQNAFSGLLSRSITGAIIGTLQAWGLDTDNLVTLSYKKNYHTMTSYKLTYKNTKLSNQNKKETTTEIKRRTNQVIYSDYNKL